MRDYQIPEEMKTYGWMGFVKEGIECISLKTATYNSLPVRGNDEPEHERRMVKQVFIEILRSQRQENK
ncbi:unnamed protein product [Mesocestoides corti]|uniref:Type I site-specific deoxyribonuclease n=1 Tax=Mesocestoides corti TaxID=53468 RepID=A0A0R3U1Z3_MESCO|nr:unnamed protein product [Mesocestoides corti]